MMSYVLWGVLVVSALLLAFVLFRNPGVFQAFGRICLHVVLGILFLYLLNLAAPYTKIELPLNGATVGTVTLLGIPGLVLLVALKLWIIV